MTDPNRGGQPNSEGASTGKRKGGSPRRRGKGKKSGPVRNGHDASASAGSAGTPVADTSAVSAASSGATSGGDDTGKVVEALNQAAAESAKAAQELQDVKDCIGSADVVIFAHTHRPSIARDRHGRLFVNPGEVAGWMFRRPTVAVYDTETREAEIVNLPAMPPAVEIEQWG